MNVHEQINIMRRAYRVLMFMCVNMGLREAHGKLSQLHDEMLREIERKHKDDVDLTNK
jgi:hypothetical protein